VAGVSYLGRFACWVAAPCEASALAAVATRDGPQGSNRGADVEEARACPAGAAVEHAARNPLGLAKLVNCVGCFGFHRALHELKCTLIYRNDASGVAYRSPELT
jgi:hypothetical protein